jgi:hypothetical protein
LIRCVRDIVNGHVNIDDIAIIIARTLIEDIEIEFEDLWRGYSSLGDAWHGLDRDAVMNVVFELFASNLVYQPRTQQIIARYPAGYSTVWTMAIEYDAIASQIENSTVRSSWEEFLTVMSLAK